MPPSLRVGTFDLLPLGMTTESLKPQPRTTGVKRAEKGVVTLLTESKVYRDYERAFVAGTGLPLLLHAPEMLTVIRYVRKQENPFCTLMADTAQWCTASYALQRKVESEAQLAPRTLKGFDGLCETSVPVRIGENLIAFLQTGQVLLHQPDRSQFDAIARTLVAWGSAVDLKVAEDAWFNTRVIAPRQYEALIHLIDIFAHNLASCGNMLILNQQKPERPEISKACFFIAEHSSNEISLAAVALVAGMSANYFSGQFAESTGVNFVEYVSRIRIEKARDFLQNPDLRISEIAFEVGFQSLSQFNRAFKRVEGCSPREYRAGVAAN